ncbi:retrotransposon protein, putative, ty1-copia subclass [Tanacetum coccineum]
MTKLSKIRGNEIIMISKMRDKINSRKKRLNLEEAKGQESRNRYKWIFKKKRKADGTINKYKARLVIKGFGQREGLDYFDTYSLVTRTTSVRMILAIAALINLKIHQIDMKKAFLNGDLEEEIYMNQPEGFMAPD